jgi:hypothetical protein
MMMGLEEREKSRMFVAIKVCMDILLSKRAILVRRNDQL